MKAELGTPQSQCRQTACQVSDAAPAGKPNQGLLDSNRYPRGERECGARRVWLGEGVDPRVAASGCLRQELCHHSQPSHGEQRPLSLCGERGVSKADHVSEAQAPAGAETWAVMLAPVPSVAGPGSSSLTGGQVAR